jgi:hypothetical protein
MLLAARFFSELDVVFFPICVIFFYYIIKNRANRNTDPRIRRLYFRAFYFKVICVIAYTLITEFYFKGGDTGLYYQASKDLRAAISADLSNLWPAISSSQLTRESPLFNYFYYDNYGYDITYGYMLSAHNFLPGRLALLPSFIFGGSYICINMSFGFFALGGAIRFFKTFYYFYPKLYRELALATLFLPGVAFWSAGLLKDPISFGCIGYILYAVVSIFFRKKNYWASAFWILFCSYLLYSSKVYILLVLILSFVIWAFAEFNKLIKDKVLRNIFTALSFAISIGMGLITLNYVTSSEAASEYQLDNILTNAEKERQGYATIAEQIQGDSHFQINTSNLFLLVGGGVSATFYRPFLWEINTPIALLSAIESTIFLLITLIFVFRKGIRQFFTIPFSDGKMIMCFIFAFVFAVAVGISTANFGALSRYKIPCMPFYLILLILMYNKTGLPYPKFFNSIINFAVPK